MGLKPEPPGEAFERILRRLRPLRKTRRPLRNLAGFCLAEDVRADQDMPPCDRSAMGGYAVISAELSSCPCTLRLVGEIAAGGELRPAVRPGTCVRILTGANMLRGRAQRIS